MRCDHDRVEVVSLIGNSVPLRAGSVVALAFGTIGEGLASEWLVEFRGFLRAVDGTRDRFKILPAAEVSCLSIDVVSGWRRTATRADISDPDERVNSCPSPKSNSRLAPPLVSRESTSSLLSPMQIFSKRSFASDSTSTGGTGRWDHHDGRSVERAH